MEEEDSIFGLSRDQLHRLLSVGTDGGDRAEGEGREAAGRKGRGDGSNANHEANQDLGEDSRPGEAAASLGAVLEQPGGWIGRYRLLGVLGEGGMGVVYLAEQEHPIRRQVALKVIKPGMDTSQVVARFEAERQALAMMDHPNIAKVLDAGTTEAGRSFFVMEYVEGTQITDYCDEHKLTIENRLKLFLAVCHAVQHAHQKGIIHRDIKPSNILVATQRDQATPKIIDFGVAKALSQPLTQRTLFTEQGQLFGTPEYMSPEQVDMAGEDIDTRSDVYSLGVLLYALLTGVLPFDSGSLREGGIEHIRRTIRETDAKTPSTRLTSLGDEAKDIAASRCTEVTSLAKRLKKELEWIPLKALRKERDERYRSASELADDIENYLKGDPLIAGPPSTVYRLEKAMRRHKALVCGVIAVMIVSSIGTVVSLVFALGQARALANSRATVDFFDEIFTEADPYRNPGEKMTVQSLLETASERLEGRFADEPLIEASLCYTLGKTYFNLSEYEAAEPYFARALQICREQLGEGHIDTLVRMLSYVDLLYRQDRHHEAEQLASEAVEIARRALGEEHPMTLNAMKALGMQLREDGRYEKAEPIFAQVLEIRRRLLGEDDIDTASAMAHVALMHCLKGRYDKAEEVFVKQVETRRRVLGEEHPLTLSGMNILARIYRLQGRYQESERLYKKTIESKAKIRSEDHVYTLVSMHGLAMLYTEQDRYDEAESLFEKVLDGYRLHYSRRPAHRRALASMNGLGVLRTKQGRYDDANDLLVRALHSGRQRLYSEHPNTLESMNALAVLRTKQRRYAEAEKLFSEALEARRCKLGEEHPDTLDTVNDLGVLWAEQKHYAKAAPLLLDAYNGRKDKLGPDHPHTIESLKQLVSLYEAWGKPEEAEKWRGKLPRR